ncbi:hypothetical protein AGMMS49921_01740 [Endomicrobiia bacterium]|nr:hypothetical protein AGMMS49921_01740 [Endomicrobiia bacterium]
MRQRKGGVGAIGEAIFGNEVGLVKAEVVGGGDGDEFEEARTVSGVGGVGDNSDEGRRREQSLRLSRSRWLQ